MFFLDDAAALAAGHRPCGLCRRADYVSFRSAVTNATANGRVVLASELNRRIAAERYRRGRGLIRAHDRILTTSLIDVLPTGTVIVDPVDREPCLVTSNHVQRFTFNGWGLPSDRPRGANVEILTKTTSVVALANGFNPRMHPTALTPSEHPQR